jgi:hypothetical protein
VISRTTAFVEPILGSQSFIFGSSFALPKDRSLQIILREFHADFTPVDRNFFSDAIRQFGLPICR